MHPVLVLAKVHVLPELHILPAKDQNQGQTLPVNANLEMDFWFHIDLFRQMCIYM